MHLFLLSTVALAAALLTACGPSTHTDAHARNAFPMGTPSRFDAPVPKKPLFGDPIVTAHSVLPPSKPDVREPLPSQTALPQATQIDAAPAATGNPQSGGAVNPAAGQAAAISDGQGEGHKQVLGAPTK